MPDLAEESTPKTFFGNSVTQIHHRVCFAPVFAVLPDLNRRAANLL